MPISILNILSMTGRKKKKPNPTYIPAASCRLTASEPIPIMQTMATPITEHIELQNIYCLSYNYYSFCRHKKVHRYVRVPVTLLVPPPLIQKLCEIDISLIFEK